MGFEGERRGKKYGFKGGVKIRNSGLKGQKNPSNFSLMTAFVIMQTAYQNAKNQRF